MGDDSTLVNAMVEQVPEWRVEMVVAEALLKVVIAALRASHPYEEPAFDVVATVNVE